MPWHADTRARYTAVLDPAAELAEPPQQGGRAPSSIAQDVPTWSAMAINQDVVMSTWNGCTETATLIDIGWDCASQVVNKTWITTEPGTDITTPGATWTKRWPASMIRHERTWTLTALSIDAHKQVTEKWQLTNAIPEGGEADAWLAAALAERYGWPTAKRRSLPAMSISPAKSTQTASGPSKKPTKTLKKPAASLQRPAMSSTTRGARGRPSPSVHATAPAAAAT